MGYMCVRACVCVRVCAWALWTLFTNIIHNLIYFSNQMFSSTNPARILEKTFPITRADKDLLSKQEYDVQVG